MQMCCKCHKRVAVVFITRGDNAGNAVNEGYCPSCARELGIKPVNDMLSKMGISEEMLESMNSELEALTGGDMGEDAGAPAIDLPKFFQNFPFPGKSGENADAETETSEEKPSRDKPKSGRKFLTAFCHSLTDDAAAGKLDRIIGREKELDRVIQILCRRQKNNPCLIGEPGVGKTAIAEALALRIASGNVPYRLKNTEIYLVDLTALVAGTQFRGQFESRILGLLKEVKAAGNILLVIDEVHNIVGSGDAEGGMNAANILKPALSRGEIQVIGATTLKEYRKYIEKDAALERRFQPVIVKEPSIADSIEMLTGIKDYYENFHRIRIPTEVVAAAVRLSERYITDRFLPDKAIDLLDESASRLSLSSPELNKLRENEKEAEEIAAERARIEALPNDTDEKAQEDHFRTLADLRVRELQLAGEAEALHAACDSITLHVSDLADVIEIWTGIPASSISDFDVERLTGLSERLTSRIVGQDEAVSAVVRAVKRKRMGISYRKNPISFIFAGPTGVGKTELVKVLAEDLFHQPESLIRLDMSEFMEKHAVSRIVGAPPGYVGYDEAGQLTEKIRRRPYSVILFDEIEKAHPDVMNILLQILDDGHITDASGREVNFENTVIIMTTNAGSEKASAVAGFAQASESAVGNDRTMRALSQFLRPEFLNRVTEVITFRALSREDFRKIADIQLSDLKEGMKEKDILFTYTEAAAAKVAEDSYSEKFGARNMRRYIETHIEDAIAEKLVAEYKNGVTGIALDVENGEWSIKTL